MLTPLIAYPRPLSVCRPQQESRCVQQNLGEARYGILWVLCGPSQAHRVDRSTTPCCNKGIRPCDSFRGRGRRYNARSLFRHAGSALAGEQELSRPSVNSWLADLSCVLSLCLALFHTFRSPMSMSKEGKNEVGLACWARGPAVGRGVSRTQHKRGVPFRLAISPSTSQMLLLY
jgi:hypothetical protein